MRSNVDPKQMKVTIRNRRKVLYEGFVDFLSSVNSMGEFDVLPRHANFVSLIKDKVVINKGKSGQKVFEIKSGLLSVDEKGISVYVGLGEDFDIYDRLPDLEAD